MRPDNLYWLFSASAQSISAFVAFLLTGFALVNSLMESARQSDETLVDIHRNLQRRYYKITAVLAVITGVGIVLSLLMLPLNPLTFKGKTLLIITASLFDLAAIAGGIWFVISIVDPRKYTRAAGQMKKAEDRLAQLSGVAVADTQFFHQFISLERRIREYLRIKDLYEPSIGAQRMSYSFRQMLDALYHNELIPGELYDELDKLNKYRNLVFHGHVTQVDQSMVDRVVKASDRLASVLALQQSLPMSGA